MMSAGFFEQHRYNVSKGPLHEGADALPGAPPAKLPVRLIAYYLPQFHAIPENDRWWGKGFTEWSNVTKAIPRYLGHRQPNLPADLGFYDLSQADVLRRQAELAKRAGIYGFCIHDYWFSGVKVLETPLKLLLENPDIDLPFCLDWANENWSRRWDGSEDDILLEQKFHPGDDAGYARSILSALRDPRYIRIDGRPLIMIYRPSLLPNAAEWVKSWRGFFTANGVASPYFVLAQSFGEMDPCVFGMDAAAGFPPHHGGWDLPNDRDDIRLLDIEFAGEAHSYAALVSRILANNPNEYRLFPGVCPRWDNEARKPGHGVSFYGSTPRSYGEWLYAAARRAMAATAADERIVFINAWNEWAEGAYLEPDRHYGFAFLAETRRVLDTLAAGDVPTRRNIVADGGDLMQARPSRHARFINRLAKLQRKIHRRLARARSKE